VGFARTLLLVDLVLDVAGGGVGVGVGVVVVVGGDGGTIERVGCRVVVSGNTYSDRS
jgi:hypothetical protein